MTGHYWIDARGDDASGEAARRGLGDLAGKEELDLIRPPQIEIVADDALEELPPTEGPVEDLGETDFGLEDRQLIGEAGGAVGGSQRQRELCLPAGEVRRHVGVAAAIADRLQRVGLGAGEKPVVEGSEPDAGPLELARGPFMAIEADLDGGGGV